MCVANIRDASIHNSTLGQFKLIQFFFMHVLIRKSGNHRVFPDIEPVLYRPSQSNERSEHPRQKLLAFSGAELPWLQRCAGFHLSPKQRLTRLLMLHRLGFEAERAGEFVQADFFWRDLACRMKTAGPCLAIWKEGCAVLGDDAPASPEAMRERIIDELLIDTHVAFFNGRLQGENPLRADDRAFAHLAFIRALLKIKGTPPEEAAQLLTPGMEAEIAALQAAKRWDEAIERAKTLATMKPDDALRLDRIALLYFAQAIDGLSRDGDELSDASWLGRRIDALDSLRSKYPHRMVIYDLIGKLYHLQSIRLANGGRVADALLAAGKAQAFAPAADSIRETLTQLVDGMNQIQDGMRDVQDGLRRSGNAQLTPGRASHESGG